MKTLLRKITENLTPVYGNGEARAISMMLLRYLFPESSDAQLLLMTECDDLKNELLTKYIERLKRNEPIQYVTGSAAFCDMDMKVAKGVLIPRPETEELVGLISNYIKDVGNRRGGADSELSVLDVGTGSGCIALAVKKQFPKTKVSGWDISADALEIAKENAQRLGLEVQFELCDILGEFKGSMVQGVKRKFDVVVSNPPYVLESERNEMERNVLDYEPESALFVPDDNPLLFYKAITSVAASLLKEGGLLAFEINRRFGNQTVEMIEDNSFVDVKLIKDQYGNDRFVTGIWKI